MIEPSKYDSTFIGAEQLKLSMQNWILQPKYYSAISPLFCRKKWSRLREQIGGLQDHCSTRQKGERGKKFISMHCTVVQIVDIMDA